MGKLSESCHLLQLFESLCSHSWAKALDEVRIDSDGVDYAGYYTYKETSDAVGKTNQILYLRKGTALQIIRYYGTANLKDKMDLFVKEFEEE